MLVWNSDILDGLTSALDRARAGHPTVLLLEADGGLGKTALLSELVARAGGFVVALADGLADDRAPFALLEQWGAQPPRRPDGSESPTRAAATSLRERLDALAPAGPVLLIADDLQWADPESVEALLLVLRRARGDRMLVAVAGRPLPPDRHPGWQRWIAAQAGIVRLPLTGMSVAQVAEVVRRRWPAVTDTLARRLHEHTGGNPLYLNSLLAENELAALSDTGMLPPPAAFARSIALRSAQLSDEALTLLRAACVVGSTWTALSLVAATADVGEAASAAQELLDAGLVDLRSVDGPAELRPAHALIRASVHRQTPLPDLRALNRRAATLVASRPASLAFRMAAAEQYDSDLADELDAYAGQLYGKRSFRQAGQFLRWASGLTPRPELRERRWLESLYYQVIGFDFTAVDAQVEDIRAARDPIWSALVLGSRAAWGRRPRAGLEHLEPVSSGPIDTTDRRTRYRIEVLLAWTRLCLGQPTELIAAGLARADAVRFDDAGLAGLHMVTSGHVSVRSHGLGPVLDRLAELPDPSAVPLPATGTLAFRGSLRLAAGLTREAVADLTEATRRIVDGVTDLGAGSFHAQLGFGQWLLGDWSRSRVSLSQAFDIAGPAAHQMTAALAPVVDIGVGRFADADAAIARARDLLTEAPWWEPCRQMLSTLMLRLHAGGSDADQAGGLARLRGTPFELPPIGRLSAGVLLNCIPALIWADRLDEAEGAVGALHRMQVRPPWSGAVTHWYRGLVHHRRGDDDRALAELQSALGHPLDLPLYRAHLLADHGRLARLHGFGDGEGSIRQAEQIYDGLGALPYLQRLRSTTAVSPSPATTTSRLPGGVTLTEREQNVVTLVVAGMSYAQIARDLFITQSTVGYHLGNIYGKAGVSSRHQLTELARKDPKPFGISLVP